MISKETRIHFFKEDVGFRLNRQEALQNWILATVRKEKFRTEQINYIFCSDRYLLRMNREYLQHDDYTDIITFDLSMVKNTVAGDIYISIERVKKNAASFGVTFGEELHRVMIHGVLHLLGYTDKSAAKKKEMRSREDFYLAKRNF